MTGDLGLFRDFKIYSVRAECPCGRAHETASLHPDPEGEVANFAPCPSCVTAFEERQKKITPVAIRRGKKAAAPPPDVLEEVQRRAEEGQRTPDPEDSPFLKGFE